LVSFAACASNNNASSLPTGQGPANRSAQRAGKKLVFLAGFNENGAAPTASVIAYNGMLYGTTSEGGVRCKPLGCGLVFSVDPSSGTMTTLYRFHGGTSDGYKPMSELTQVDGTFYGVTVDGGGGTACADGCGILYSVTPSGQYAILHKFYGKHDGHNPQGGLISLNGLLYGTTTTDANGGNGTVYSFDLATNIEKIVYRFGTSESGAAPLATMIAYNGLLYGTTSQGGLHSSDGCEPGGCGTVFSVDPIAGTASNVYEFKGGNDGGYPVGPLAIQGSQLYGTTMWGGGRCTEDTCGTVFTLTPSGSEQILERFNGSNGRYPMSGLTVTGSQLYGTTFAGGRYADGLVFVLTHKTHDFFDFDVITNGEGPQATMLFDGGVLYGTTTGGTGNGGHGTVYGLAP
jgi:uncharacterized repeat protein (TIGR03803 family)